jgi:hypothetical protein
MSETTVQPVRKEVVVEASQERAFHVFTARFASWWPPSHHIGKVDMKDAVMEPRAGGRWYEIGVDGTECDWGKVLAWEPPVRVLLAWQLDARWQHDPSFFTEVEVTFVAEGPRRTRVSLEHRNLERFGDTVAEVRGALAGPGGWTGLMEMFAKAASAEGGA